MPLSESGFVEPIRPSPQNSDGILNISNNGYVKRTGSNTYSNVASIPNADLANSAVASLSGTNTGDETLSRLQALVTATTIQRLTSGSSATYATPAGCVRIRIRCWGGGGAGGGGSTTIGAGGGAQGGYVEHIINSPASTYTYTIGAGGTGNSAAAGGNGGNTTFSGGSLIAGGGTGGSSVSGGPSIAVAGGTASGGNVNNIPGAVGNPGLIGTYNYPGAGGGQGAGLGVASGTGNAGTANTGGGGGCGGYNANTVGGAGGSGLIIVEEFYI